MLHNLSDAKAPTNRCEGLIAGPAEWHKKKVMGYQKTTSEVYVASLTLLILDFRISTFPNSTFRCSSFDTWHLKKFSGWLCKEKFSPHFSTEKRCSKRRFPLAKTVNLAVWAFSSNFLYSQYYLHPLGPLCKKIITVLGLFPSVTFAHQNVGLIWNLNIDVQPFISPLRWKLRGSLLSL